MDITRGEMVEGDLDRLIERRHDQRITSEGERATEELWAESERKYAARRREENRIAWCAYYRGIAGLYTPGRRGTSSGRRSSARRRSWGRRGVGS